MDYKLNEEEQRYIKSRCELDSISEIAKVLNKDYRAVYDFCRRKNLECICHCNGSLINNIYLTKQEIKILSLIAQGATNKEIMNKLVIAYSTTKTHVANIYTKLGLYKKDNETSFIRVRATLWYLKNVEGINLEDC